MAALTSTVRRSSNAAARLLALCALLTALAAAWLSLAPAAADGHDSPQLTLSLVEDSDNVVPPGKAFSLSGQIRYNAPAAPIRLAEILDGSHLRLSGELDWDDRDNVGAALRIPAQYLDSLPAQSLPLTPLDAAGAAYDTTTGSASGVWPVAFDSRTLVARAGTTNGLLQIFDLSADPPAQVATIAGAADERLGGQAISGGLTPDPVIAARSVAVWDQDATTAWVFAGAPGASTNVGKLYIYKLSYGDDGATVSASPTVLEVPMSEYTNRAGTFWNPYYGGAVSISADGSTLAVGARKIHATGAVYVYTMPDGDDEDWSDLDYADGVKVTPFQMPAWGTAGNMPTTRPFIETSTGRTGANTDCDAYCSAVYANWSSAFGASVELSADGSTLVVGAPRKRYSGDTEGGSFLTANFRQNAGGVWVFSAPDGGWSAAPDATAGKTLIAAQASAAAWDPEANYSPGPAKRVEQADAELIPGAYGTTRTADAYFGEPVNVSADGSTIVATARRQGVSSSARTYVFEQPDDGWADDSSADATITENATMGFWGADLNYNGGRVLVADAPYATTAPALTNVGAVYLFERADGGWSGTLAASDATLITAPTPQAGGFFSAPRYNNAGTRTVYAQTDYNGHATTAPKLWAAPGPDCSERTIEGVTTTTCAVPLGNTNVTVAPGTPDGPFTISGRIVLRFSDGTESTTPFATLAGEVGTVDELAEVDFDFATDTKGTTSTEDDTPYPSEVVPGGSTTLRLQLLNENGKASAKGAAASVLFTTARGSLSARLGSAGGEACGAAGGSACRLADPTTALTADNADQIFLTVTHPGLARVGTTQVRVLVVNAAGRTLSVDPIMVTFSGPPTALAITPPPTALLGYAPAAADADEDQRNTATLVVSASDAAGNKAAVPSANYSAKLTGPDGKQVPGAKAGVDWPLRKGGDGDDANELVLSDGNPQARVTIAAGATAPLAVGEYTLELSVGSGAGKLSATQTFSVTGGAASIALTVDPAGALEPEATIVLTAIVRDASGDPVPNGTVVTFSEQSTGANAVLVLLSQQNQRTLNGQVAVRLRAVGIGSAYVEAEADNVTGIQSVTVAAPPPPPAVERVTSVAAEAFSIWTGPGTTTASALYAELEGVWRVRKWTGSKWASYGETDGLLNSGSVDFLIERGDVLWLSGR